jgi:hypothetical protein
MTPQRRIPGILRRLRLYVVRDVLWEKEHPESFIGRGVPEYAHPWMSLSALSKWNPSHGRRCLVCARPRYSRKQKHPEVAE